MHYYLNGSRLMGLRKGSDSVRFVYDPEGKPLLMQVNGETDYYYLYNGQGDVVGLVDKSNNVVVEYKYDSWGKALVAIDTTGKPISLLNPFRYCGYIYDAESRLYYVGSRYYDPEIGWFVNADDVAVLNVEQGSLMQ